MTSPSPHSHARWFSRSTTAAWPVAGHVDGSANSNVGSGTAVVVGATCRGRHCRGRVGRLRWRPPKCQPARWPAGRSPVALCRRALGRRTLGRRPTRSRHRWSERWRPDRGSRPSPIPPAVRAPERSVQWRHRPPQRSTRRARHASSTSGGAVYGRPGRDIIATGSPRPASLRTVAIRRPGWTASFAAPTRSGPANARGRVEIGHVDHHTPERGGIVADLGTLDDLDDQSAPADPVESLPCVAQVAHPLERRARGVRDRAARAFERAGEHDDVVELDRPRWRAGRSAGGDSSTTVVGSPSMSWIAESMPLSAQPRMPGSPSTMRSDVNKNGTSPSAPTVRPSVRHCSRSPPIVSHSTRPSRDSVTA